MGGKDGFFGRVDLVEWRREPAAKKRKSSPSCYMCQYCSVTYWDGRDCEIHKSYRHVYRGPGAKTDAKTQKEQGMIYEAGPKRARVVKQLKKCIRK